jgi:4'-phosphopantetheinyl transferase EntD
MFDSPFPKQVGFACVNQDSLPGQGKLWGKLHPQEAALIKPCASEKRRLDFSLGRLAAHITLEQLGFGLREPALLQGKKGEPLWPEGIVGSITHAKGYAISAAAYTHSAKAVGIDLECFDRKTHWAISRHICLPEELLWVGKSPDHGNQQRLLSLFSAKESVFKALYPLCHCFISFKDVLLLWNSEKGSFAGELKKTLSREFTRGYCFEVGLQKKDNFVLTYLLLR